MIKAWQWQYWGSIRHQGNVRTTNNQMETFNFMKAKLPAASTACDNTSTPFSDIAWIFHYLTLLFFSMQLTDAECPVLKFAICIGNGQWYQFEQVPIDVLNPVMPVASGNSRDDASMVHRWWMNKGKSPAARASWLQFKLGRARNQFCPLNCALPRYLRQGWIQDSKSDGKSGRPYELANQA